MSTVSELAQAAAELSLEEQRILVERLQSSLEAQSNIVPEGPRVLGLGAGQWWMSDDFNDPLPDEFFLGEDASTESDPTDAECMEKPKNA